jgi:predicted nucleic acid-binding protein
MIVCLDTDCVIYFVEQNRLKVPDCLHLAAAVEHGCGRFLSHDEHLRGCEAIPVEILG